MSISPVKISDSEVSVPVQSLMNTDCRCSTGFHCNLASLTTPQPSIVVEEDNIKIYIDWTFICSSNSIEQSFAILVGLYCLMNLKFHAYRSAIRFLYVYFLNDKQQQSNSIRRFFKEYNIELPDKLSRSVSPLEESMNDNKLDLDESENSDHVLTVVNEEKNNEVIRDESSISITKPRSVTRQTTHKRKADQLIDPENTGEENTPPTKRTTRSTNQKRR